MASMIVEFRQDRDTNWWTVTVPAQPAVVSQGKTLKEAYERVRAALQVVHPAAHSLKLVGKTVWDDRTDLPPEVLAAVKTESALRLKHLELGAELEQSTQEAVYVLIDGHKLTYRSAGQLLGITHQRVEQIHKSLVGAQIRTHIEVG